MILSKSLAVFAATSIVCFSFNASAAKNDSEVSKSDKRSPFAEEGNRNDRETYLEQRRINSNETENFVPAKARFEAIQRMQAQSRAPRVMPNIANPIWKAVGPAPTIGGQTPTFDPRIPSPVVGRVSALALDTTDNMLLMGAAQGGIWRTRNNGTSWEPLGDGLASQAIGAIAIDAAPHNAGQATVYLGTGEANFSCDSYAGIGLYKSTNSGSNWAGPFGATQFTGRTIGGIVVDRLDSNNVLLTSASGIFAAACVALPGTLPEMGVYRSTDAGVSWAKVSPGSNPGSNIIQDPVVNNRFWAAMRVSAALANSGGLLRSDDNGATWTQVMGTGGLPALTAAGLGRTWITGGAASGSSSSTLYLGTSESPAAGQGGRIYKSADGGLNWVELTAGRNYCQGQCFYDMPITAEPNNPEVLYTGGAGASTPNVVPSQFMRSDNGGTSFADRVRSADGATAVHADMHQILVDPSNPSKVWIGNDGGVWLSNDRGTNLINANGNLATMQHVGCDTHPTDANVIYSGTQDNGTMARINGTSVWKHLDFGDGGYSLMDQSNPNNLVHTYTGKSIGYTAGGFATTMGGYLTSLSPGNGVVSADRQLFYSPLHFDRGTKNTLYFGTNKLYRAVNFFANAATPNHFQALAGGQDLSPSTGSISAIETFASTVAGQDAQIIFTGSSIGRVFRSIDSGATFTAVDVDASPLYVSDIAVDPRNLSLVYQSRSGFGAGQQIRKSTDSGLTWTASATGLPNIPVNTLVVDPFNAGTLWAGTDIGMYVSTDAAASWFPLNDGMPAVSVWRMKANATTRTLAACTHGRSVYTMDLTAPESLQFQNGFEGIAPPF